MRYLALIALVTVAAGCGGGSSNTLPTGSEQVTLDPADFTTEIDEPVLADGARRPLGLPGDRRRRRRAEGRGDGDRPDEDDRTASRRGSSTTSSPRTASSIEDTFDWYAQDADGNVWYLGEDTKEFENGKVTTTAGSWEHGVDGAQAGVIVPADPEPGLEYRQEYYAGEAEDAADRALARRAGGGARPAPTATCS